MSFFHEYINTLVAAVTVLIKWCSLLNSNVPRSRRLGGCSHLGRKNVYYPYLLLLAARFCPQEFDKIASMIYIFLLGFDVIFEKWAISATKTCSKNHPLLRVWGNHGVQDLCGEKNQWNLYYVDNKATEEQQKFVLFSLLNVNTGLILLSCIQWTRHCRWTECLNFPAISALLCLL